MTTKKYVIGIDYGTDSVRALIVSALNEFGLKFYMYSGQMKKSGMQLTPGLNIVTGYRRF